LRDQWAGLFRELINRQSTDQKISDLAIEVDSLRDVTVTLKRYLEELVKKEVGGGPSTATTGVNAASQLIAQEEKRLSDSDKRRTLKQNAFVNYVAREIASHSILTLEHALNEVIDIIASARSKEELEQKLGRTAPTAAKEAKELLDSVKEARTYLDQAREVLGKPPLSVE
jgi:hypothetical protein